MNFHVNSRELSQKSLFNANCSLGAICPRECFVNFRETVVAGVDLVVAGIVFGVNSREYSRASEKHLFVVFCPFASVLVSLGSFPVGTYLVHLRRLRVSSRRRRLRRPLVVSIGGVDCHVVVVGRGGGCGHSADAANRTSH